MRWSLRIAVSLVFVGAGLGPASAGIYYEAVTSTEADRGSGGDFHATVHAWVDGDSAKVEFVETGMPMTEPGNYLITTDAGATIYLVNPADRTYAEWDLEAMLNMAAQVMEGMRGMVDLEFSNVSTEKLVEEDGGDRLGYSTTHFQWKTGYTMDVRVMGFKQHADVETVQDSWITEEIGDEAMKLWLRNAPRRTGNERLDVLIEAELAKAVGLPLKSVAVSTTTNKKGKTSVTTTTNEVTVLREEEIDPAIFEIPGDYERITIVPEMEEGQQQENPLKGLFRRKKKKG